MFEKRGMTCLTDDLLSSFDGCSDTRDDGLSQSLSRMQEKERVDFDRDEPLEEKNGGKL